MFFWSQVGGENSPLKPVEILSHRTWGSDLCSFSMPGMDPGTGLYMQAELLNHPFEMDCEKGDQPPQICLKI